MFSPEIVPKLEPVLLFVHGTDIGGDIGKLVQLLLLLQTVKNSRQLSATAQSLIPCIALGNDIHIRSVVESCRCLQIRQQSLLLISHVIDMMHVGIEGDAKAEITQDDGQRKDYPQQPAMTLRRGCR